MVSHGLQYIVCMDLNGTEEVPSPTDVCHTESSSPLLNPCLAGGGGGAVTLNQRPSLWSSSSQLYMDHSNLAVPQSLVECKVCWKDAQGLYPINMLCSHLIPLSLALAGCPPHTSALAGYFGKVWLELSSYTPLKVLFYPEESGTLQLHDFLCDIFINLFFV
jgi:hypothetical protein